MEVGCDNTNKFRNAVLVKDVTGFRFAPFLPVLTVPFFWDLSARQGQRACVCVWAAVGALEEESGEWR